MNSIRKHKGIEKSYGWKTRGELASQVSECLWDVAWGASVNVFSWGVANVLLGRSHSFFRRHLELSRMTLDDAGSKQTYVFLWNLSPLLCSDLFFSCYFCLKVWCFVTVTTPACFCFPSACGILNPFSPCVFVSGVSLLIDSISLHPVCLLS